ncbi:hypothetical protein O4H66_18035 [Comamonadaceae bacterium G21597-S1]|nr:hypothetical protein [Comamonadaceae bacterium G21597-S1]
MNKSDPPRSFGVFKPVGHTVLVFPDAHALEQAARKLAETGLSDGSETRYSAQEMQAQVASDLSNAGVLATVGQELNLVKVHGQLADRGCQFLVVPTDSDAVARRVADVARAGGAVAAQHYGTLLVEDLIDPADGKGQVFESPDRGLDAKLPTS